MFNYLSGFVSDLDLDQKASVYVFLLFPTKYIKYLKKGLFQNFIGYMPSNLMPHFQSVTINGGGNVYGEYIPFCLPIKATYVRDTGVYLPSKKEPMVTWLEQNLNIDLKTYLEELSERNYPKEVKEIDLNNIIDYLAVGFEYIDFVDKVAKVIVKDEEFRRKQRNVVDLFRNHNVSLIQNLVIGEDLSLLKEKYTQSDLIMNSSKIKEECYENAESMVREVFIIAALSFFMVRTNRQYQPCNFGNQQYKRDYLNLMLKTKEEIADKLFTEDDI